MKTSHLISLILLSLLASCSSPPPPPAEVQIQTVEVPITVLVPVTTTPSTVEPPATAEVTAEENRDPSEQPSSGNIITHTDIAAEEVNGFEVEIVELSFGDRSDMIAERIVPFMKASTKLYYEEELLWWDQFEVVGELVLRYTNNAESLAEPFLTSGSFAVNGEQVDLRAEMDSDYFTHGNDMLFSDSILPSSTAEGGIWFGLKRLSLDDLIELESVGLSLPVSIGEDRAEILLIYP